MEVETVTSHSFDLPPPVFPSRSHSMEFESAAAGASPSPAEPDPVVLGGLETTAMAVGASPSPAELQEEVIGGRSESNGLRSKANGAHLHGDGLGTAAPGALPSPSELKPTAPSLSLESNGLDSPAAGGPISEKSVSTAATRVQKVYRSYRTRRRLADSAVVAEELWWQAIDYARLNHSTVSFFDDLKPETAISRWNRISLNASKVGQGLSKDDKAQKLAFQHWIEAIDPRHRYGHNLHFYYDEWCKSQAGQPFFHWLDIGDGRDVDLKECPRSLLRKQCIKYLGPQEREHYEYIPTDGKIVHKQSGELLDTNKGSEKGKWIFVMSTSRRLYAGQKKKGMFHHSSFLAGGATVAAGRFTAENGVLKCIWAYSGHYHPTEENLSNFLSFLRENGVDLNEVKRPSSSNEDYYDDPKQDQAEKVTEVLKAIKPPQLVLPAGMVETPHLEPAVSSQSDEPARVSEAQGIYKRTLSGGLQSPRADVPHKVILERIKSKRKASSLQLGHQLSLKWCSGAGPRIGCVADYPWEVRVQALEFVNLSPRVSTLLNSQQSASISPTSSLPSMFISTQRSCPPDLFHDIASSDA